MFKKILELWINGCLSMIYLLNKKERTLFIEKYRKTVYQEVKL